MIRKLNWAALVLVGVSLAPHVRGEQDPSGAQDARDLVHTAEAQYRAGRYSASADAYIAAIEAGAESAAVRFDAARSTVLAGRIDAGFQLLRAALEAGYRDLDELRKSQDLAKLHPDSRWQKVLALCEENESAYLKTLGNPALHRELMAMMRVDQDVRTMDHKTHAQNQPHATGHEHADGSEHTDEHTDHDSGDLQQQAPGHDSVHGSGMRDVDAQHTARMKQILAKHGWPMKSMVGSDGATAAWLLIQHADAEPKFQRHCLELMIEAPRGEVSLSSIAYLTDRVLVNEGEQQLFGTQFQLVDGEMAPRPIRDPERLDARRKAAGLSTMKEYAAHMTGDHDH